ncbi:hypothetical protein ACVH9Z_13100 [Rhodococcus opacus]|jgi:hypothetical protein|uniref:Dihydrodiol dehydrogenase n=1 Tax=Rhodococcus opacus TaxID=37919 RepID=A0A1B1KG92_RHOOP|nr:MULTISPECIES: hypothetical protein [Rhodococcus]ELB86368.1 hypothetical protein Rwratislav_45235 [Rhodococcus wratislaviensis IFP 2016]NDV05972.1 hypothetical protein [Rhodococcus sp. IEGM 248]NHU44657.1 hypothetical protein [Rhodococcus sp. A14]ANS31608.1 hypothetical protein R1CP_35000 [Rhodococcus opacus]MBA8961594.1 hypothetical protein [Rhodococcus opacus]
MSLQWEGEEQDARAARRATDEFAQLLAGAVGDPLTIANEFAEVSVHKVATRNGVRLLVHAPKSGQWVCVDPLELEALTWQNPATFAAMVGNMFAPLIAEGDNE